LWLGAQRAVASWGRWSVQGRWVWRWKDHTDRKFVARYRPDAGAAAPPLTPA
jgi:hypothetical protein